MLRLIFSCFLFVSVSTFQFENNVCDHDIYYPVRYIDNKHCNKNPDVFSNTEAIIARHNLPIKSYTYVNSDGYIMTLHRIPSKNQTKPVIYLQHGILTNSMIFVDVNVRSIAFFLSSLGYDVWLGNQRGVRDCKQHVSLSPTINSKFWSFNLDDLAAVDVRENLRFIANETDKAGSIIFLGYSMGTTLSYMYASRYPDEAQILLKAIISLAPVAFVDGTSKDFQRKVFGPPAAFITKIFGIAVLIPDEDLFGKLAFGVCTAAPWLCRLAIRIMFGPSDQLASQDIPIFASLFWGSASRDQFVHYLQIVLSKKLQMFDYKRNNRKRYGQDQPPEYDLSKMTTPTFLFYGLGDIVATPKNVERLYKAVGSRKKGMFKIPESEDSHAFNHLDFLYSKDLDKFLYPKLHQVLLDEL